MLRLQLKMLNEQEVIEMANSGDEDAFNKLFNEYRETIYQFAISALGDHDKAQEATQRTMIFCWQKIKNGEFDNKKNKFKTWALAVCKNYNKKVREGRLGDDILWKKQRCFPEDSSDTVFDTVSSKISGKTIDEKIGDILSPQQYQVFTMYADGFTTKQISRELRIAQSSVRSNLRHARIKINKNVQKLDIT